MSDQTTIVLNLTTVDFTGWDTTSDEGGNRSEYSDNDLDSKQQRSRTPNNNDSVQSKVRSNTNTPLIPITALPPAKIVLYDNQQLEALPPGQLLEVGPYDIIPQINLKVQRHWRAVAEEHAPFLIEL
jgi:hypothetical protein